MRYMIMTDASSRTCIYARWEHRREVVGRCESDIYIKAATTLNHVLLYKPKHIFDTYINILYHTHNGSFSC